MDDITKQLVLLLHAYGPAKLTVDEVNGTVKSLIKIIQEPKRWHLQDLAITQVKAKT